MRSFSNEENSIAIAQAVEVNIAAMKKFSITERSCMG
jgi:hypothetical protein